MNNFMRKTLQLISIFFLLFFVKASFLEAWVDLEERQNDCILTLKKIEIPGHPHAFNPSFIRWKDRYLMSFREILDPATAQVSELSSVSESFVGYVWLDEFFEVMKEAQFFEWSLPGCCKAEDARLVLVGDEVFLVFSDNRDENFDENKFRMYISRLEINGSDVHILETVLLKYFEGEKETRREKNWMPFDYQGLLFLVYSVFPHKIFYPLPETETCETVATTFPQRNWKWGEVRGGTPAISIGDQYLAFFHSSMEMKSVQSEEQKTLHYFMGAYTFEKDPPFRVTGMSPHPIISKGFYSGNRYVPYWKPVQVIFPCGLIADGPYLWVSYGRQDHEIWIAKVDLAKLLNSLTVVE
jgi:predicted GH43/DUF377 family glycosyl hydrolase